MRRLVKNLKGFVLDDSGQGMIEYILIIGLIVIVIVVALVAFRKQVEKFLTDIGNYFSKQTVP
ncbi:MAG TPA: hypothetical protein VHL58_08930 [Thermoanaerobaculia bacterium]|nr:hypothetical protein [Thermoanaerobaculia bacterium]